ncbi:MAG: class I SAM-dependent methyltransferase [Thermoplasmatota archaeon]
MLNRDGRRWLEGLGMEMLKKIGIQPGHHVLDFGCGSGFYAIPAAMLVGDEGKVIALDKNRRKLKVAAQRAWTRGLTNMDIVQTTGDLTLPFPDATMDVVLLYDVLHSDFFDDGGREQLLAEIRRVLKPEGVLSIYPRHMSRGQAITVATTAGFRLVQQLETMLHHGHNIVTDTVFMFTLH